MLRFYLMTSPEFRRPVAAAVRGCGHEVVDPPTSTTCDASQSVIPTLLGLNAMVFDFNVHKFRFVEAGFWRGRGMPVVYISAPSRKESDKAKKYAARLGIYPCQSVAHFAAWLSKEPAYLMPPAFQSENGQTPECCRKCGTQLREHWNGTDYVCRTCGEYTDADTGRVTRPARAGKPAGGW